MSVVSKNILGRIEEDADPRTVKLIVIDKMKQLVHEYKDSIREMTRDVEYYSKDLDPKDHRHMKQLSLAQSNLEAVKKIHDFLEKNIHSIH